MEGVDVINVPEYGFRLAADIGRRIGAVGMLPVMGGEEVHLFDKLRLSIYQFLDELAEDMK